MTRPDHTPAEVARWMAERVTKRGYLDQETAVLEIERWFGSPFVYDNEAGNRAVDPRVLDAFRKLTDQTVVWERASRVWRPRREGDPEGRQV